MYLSWLSLSLARSLPPSLRSCIPFARHIEQSTSNFHWIIIAWTWARDVFLRLRRSSFSIIDHLCVHRCWHCCCCSQLAVPSSNAFFLHWKGKKTLPSACIRWLIVECAVWQSLVGLFYVKCELLCKSHDKLLTSLDKSLPLVERQTHKFQPYNFLRSFAYLLKQMRLHELEFGVCVVPNAVWIFWYFGQLEIISRFSSLGMVNEPLTHCLPFILSLFSLSPVLTTFLPLNFDQWTNHLSTTHRRRGRRRRRLWQNVQSMTQCFTFKWPLNCSSINSFGPFHWRKCSRSRNYLYIQNTRRLPFLPCCQSIELFSNTYTALATIQK